MYTNCVIYKKKKLDDHENAVDTYAETMANKYNFKVWTKTNIIMSQHKRYFYIKCIFKPILVLP